MPAGTSWLNYLTFLATATASMLAGAQCVHVCYKPLEDLDKYIEAEVKERSKSKT